MERETSLSNLRCLAAYPFMGNASGENPEDKSSYRRDRDRIVVAISAYQ
jgi:hypothetical protein